MTSNELKHEAKKQEWSMSIQECRGSGLSVSEWCRQRGVTTATYYRWERELLTGVRKNGAPPSTAVTFAELPAPKQVSCNVAERCATLHIGKASLDIYPGCNAEQLRLLVEFLRCSGRVKLATYLGKSPAHDELENLMPWHPAVRHREHIRKSANE